MEKTINKKMRNSIFYTNLSKVLEQNNIPGYDYSIGKYADDCYCVTREDGKWVVFSGSRGQKVNPKNYFSDLAAGRDLLTRISESSEEAMTMKNEFMALMDAGKMKDAGIAKKSKSCSSNVAIGVIGPKRGKGVRVAKAGRRRTNTEKRYAAKMVKQEK